MTSDMDNPGAAAGEFWKKIEHINGLSFETGLQRVSGRREVFEQTLRLMVKEIEKCDRNLRAFLKAGDMRGFTIEVHSMKGSLANIGAMELSADAKELEAAARREDAAFCALNLPPLLAALETLKTGLQDAFDAMRGEYAPLTIPPELLPVLRKLETACAAMDFERIAGGMDELDTMNFSGALKEEIEAIQDAVLMMDYESALAVMRKLSVH